MKKKENVAVTGDDLWFDRFVRLREFALKDLVEKEGIDPDNLEAIFSHQSSLIKDIYKASRRFLEDTERNYPKQLRYSKADPFPREWMRRDKAISRIIETHPTFVKLANYLFERNRRWRGDKLKKMREEADALMGGRRDPDKHIFSTFVTNSAFYDETTAKLSLSKSSVEKYLGAFAKIGIIRALCDSGTRGMLYADGCFVQSSDNRYRKTSFLKDDPAIKAGLRRLPGFVRNYQKVRVHFQT